MKGPVIIPGEQMRAGVQPPIAAAGHSFVFDEWNGSGPGYLHVHYADDEAWQLGER